MSTKIIGRKGHEEETMNNQVHSLKDVTPYANLSFFNTWKSLTFSNEHKKKKSKRHEANGDDVELSATETKAIGLEGDIDQSNHEIVKNWKKKTRKSE